MDLPKVSIITCVYNGEKYIENLFKSVMEMDYPNIEHIVVNDGSIDNTEKIISKYSKLYKNQINKKLYIKYIKQSNTGLGGATNNGLKRVTGKYWTWINCDDWYEKGAFFEPIDLLEKITSLDYVQLNGWFIDEKNTKKIIIDKDSKMAFKNKKKLICQYAECTNFKWLLYLVRTSSYKNINETMSIYPSKYTQDDQLICQMFGLLNGNFCQKPSWFFLQRSNNYHSYINNELEMEKQSLLIYEESIKYVNARKKQKASIINVIKDGIILEELKCCAIDKKKIEAFKKFIFILIIRLHISLSYWLYLDHHILLYLIYSFLPFEQKK